MLESEVFVDRLGYSLWHRLLLVEVMVVAFALREHIWLLVALVSKHDVSLILLILVGLEPQLAVLFYEHLKFKFLI